MQNQITKLQRRNNLTEKAVEIAVVSWVLIGLAAPLVQLL